MQNQCQVVQLSVLRTSLPLHLVASYGKVKAYAIYVGVCNMTAPFETVIGYMI